MSLMYLINGPMSYLRQGMLSRTLSGVLLRGLWGWGECPLGSEKHGVFSVSDGEITSSISHCSRTSRDFKRISTHTQMQTKMQSSIHSFHSGYFNYHSTCLVTFKCSELTVMVVLASYLLKRYRMTWALMPTTQKIRLCGHQLIIWTA